MEYILGQGLAHAQFHFFVCLARLRLGAKSGPKTFNEHSPNVH